MPAASSLRDAASPKSGITGTRLTSPAAAHLVGICGSGMKSLAELLIGQGWTVSGSDLQPASPTTEMFRKRGLRVHQGHHGQFLPDDADVLVYSPAVGESNPERIAATFRGIPQLSYSEMLGRLMRDKVGVSIAGTHGKSTTTAMTAFVLEAAGLAPSAIIGAELRGGYPSGWSGSGNLFVVESCEYQQSFLNLTPQYAAILGIEADHFDCYPTLDALTAAFAAFARRVPDEGTVIIRHECPVSAAVCSGIGAEVQTFSLEPGADWWAADLRSNRLGMRFRIFRRGEYFTEVALQIPGRHNVLNALAAAALCFQAGAGTQSIREGLGDFAGVRRRFDIVGSWRGVTLIDDYAHHPTAIQATLRTARDYFGGRRLWCVFQPHQVSRTRALMTEFASSFADADEVLVTPVYGARENFKGELQDVSQDLVARIVLQGPQARFTATLDQTLLTLEDEVQPGDVLMTMGAGDIDQVHHAFTCRLQRNYAPR